ncbi:MAG: hypothetical protein WBA57_08950 [Elainellaceae cyanobacterium]
MNMNGFEDDELDLNSSSKTKQLDQASVESLEQWFLDAIERKQTKLKLLFIFLCISSMSQFIIIDFSLALNFGLDKNSPDFFLDLIPVFFVSCLITAALPVTTFVDEFNLLEQSLIINIFGKRLSPIIWIILPSDFILTFQAIYSIGAENTARSGAVTLLGFLAAAIFSTSSLYVSRGIATSFKQLKEALKHLQVLKTYHVSPIDLYEDVERVELQRKIEQALFKAELIGEESNQETFNRMDLDQIAKQEHRVSGVGAHRPEQQADSKSQSRLRFEKIREPIFSLIDQAKNRIGKL